MTRPNPHAGKTIIEIMWEELDDIMDRLMADGQPTLDVRDINQEDLVAVREWGEDRGQAQGVAYCLAVATNPYAVSVEDIKKEALRRWRERNDEDDN